ncbi:MAG: SDR family oxidoreductase [Chloroflexota bacterium]|nr:SDR family oxidoreductase [Chloroflexota bacterium]MDE2897004.1 SDR family oxidoreductase [Chloroflexota bacterium]
MILVTGATGYIGGRLVPRLIEEGHGVRVLVRSRARALSRSWSSQVEIVVGDVLSPEDLSESLRGVETAYYLIHSMSTVASFRDLDIRAARSFGSAARRAGVQRIIYLGGLGESAADLSHHLRSRHETGLALRECGVPVTEFRAAVIVGSGSISFEMIRYLVERLPVMVCPTWIYSRIQPIALQDVLNYLAAALDVSESKSQTVEIGGSDVTTYRGLLLGYAKARGLRRLLLPVQVLTPRLSSYWVHWMTPIPSGISRALVEGLRNDVVVTDDLARRLFPGIKPLSYASALNEVIQDLDTGLIDTSWSDAAGPTPEPGKPVVLESRQGLIVERRSRRISAPAGDVFRVIAGIGAARGWYFANWTWRIRGVLDRLLGGPGLRRGRRHPDDLRIGDAVDFWRVEDLDVDRLIRLRAEMKLPGRAWLQFRLTVAPDGSTHMDQTASFSPKGLGGLLYWYALYPVHAWIFDGLATAIARRAESVGHPRQDSNLRPTA